ncbi:hypothetical protein ACP4OV_015908 [Aristida adscensionis]
MEFFPDLHHVRLRSRARGAYLHADESGRCVSLRPRGARASPNAAWLVRRILRGGAPWFLLQSAAYGRYLVATPWEAPPGHRGLLAGVRDRDEAEAADPFVWTAVAAAATGNGGVLVRHISGRLLRANGRYRFWHTGVTVDDNDHRSTMTHWVVEAIPLRAAPLPMPGAIQQQSTGVFGGLLRLRRAVAPSEQRTIRYVRVDQHGDFDDDDWGEFDFYGRSLFNLRIELALLVGDVDFFFAMLPCVRAGVHGGLIPLTVDLPRSTEPMEIVAVTIGTPGDERICGFNSHL